MPQPHRKNLQLPISNAEPQVMHIDLNSCFATVEQQARPLLRGKPVVVTNRGPRPRPLHSSAEGDFFSRNGRSRTNGTVTEYRREKSRSVPRTPEQAELGSDRAGVVQRSWEYTCVVAASIEAKARGVKVGMSLHDARILCPDIICVETDPPKYHHVYQVLVGIMRSYSPNVTMKSIDEGVIDFAGTTKVINTRSLEAIGHEIKQRLKDEVGSWMRCNVGIAPNRFLAKQAAGLHKPDGLDIIDHKNLRKTFASLKLTDLTGIAERNQARLNSAGIMTPLQFLDAPADLLRIRVFRSVCGEDWYQRLRGYEVDNQEWDTKTVGRQYVLEEMRPSAESVFTKLMYLCETTAVKLRYKGLAARGIFVYVRYASGDYWYERCKFKTTFFTNIEVMRRASLLFNRRPLDDYPREIGVSCYGIEPSTINQISLLEEVNKEVWLTQAMDRINSEFGEFTITMASSLEAKGVVKQKIPFGSTRYFELLCNKTYSG
jgi:DNA polymerase-4